MMIATPLLAVLLVAGQPAAGPRFVQTAVSLDATLDYDTPSIDGTAILTLENRGTTGASEVSLLLNRLMAVRTVRAGGQALRFDQKVEVFSDISMLQVAHVRVQLPEPVAPRARTTIEVRYGGPLVGYTETGMLYIKDHIDPAFTILRRDAYAFPVPGVLSMAANRSVKERYATRETALMFPIVSSARSVAACG